jgi:hypothetical protein
MEDEMADWRDHILSEFTPQVARLTLVADPDGLLLEEGVLNGIRERGFELIPFDDHVAFRYAYESQFRSRWDKGEQTDLVVVLRSPSSDLESLPFDLLQTGRKLTFGLVELFPNLSYPVVASLDRSDLDAVYEAQTHHNPGTLGDNATKDFLLQHVFGIAPGTIQTATDLLRVLLRLHYRQQSLPTVLKDRLSQVLRTNTQFEGWPLDQIIPERGAFLAFLQERWPVFLDRVAASDGKEVHERQGTYSLKYSGPVDLPFDHDDVRVYVDNLFIEGALQPVSYDQAERLKGRWVRVGVRTAPGEDRLRRLHGLLKSLRETMPGVTARHHEWFTTAYRWAEATVLALESPEKLADAVGAEFAGIRDVIDAAFYAWVQGRYATLYNQPPVPPVMLHHIPRALSRLSERTPDQRTALVVVDGLALDQWVVMREAILALCPELQFRESAVFAWLPTITSVSRQAAFAGKAPLYFPASIGSTERESHLWVQFWLDQGLMPRNVLYLRLSSDADWGEASAQAADESVRVMGLVVDKVDRIMHGMELGTPGMHNQIKQWISGGQLAGLLTGLADQEFAVTLTSDHGNIEARGCGTPGEGRVADLRGERVRVYPDLGLRSRAKAAYPSAIEWSGPGLPEDFFTLFAPGRSAFVRVGEQIVAHGGLSLEETIVPLVQVTRVER